MKCERRIDQHATNVSGAKKKSESPTGITHDLQNTISTELRELIEGKAI